MKSQHLGVILSTAIFSVCLPQRTSAGTLYPLTYVDEGSSIAITDCENFFSGNLVIPPNINGKPVTAIKAQAFAYAQRLKSISIPPTVTDIGENAFYLCGELQSVNIPPGVTQIKNGTFQHCSDLASVVIPATVTYIGLDAFAWCKKLDNVVFPASVTEIGAGAFSNCKLVNVVIPETVKVIGDFAFAGCASQSVKIRSGGARIGKKVFQSCPYLREVDLSPGFSEISDSMFLRCVALKRLKLPSSVKRIGVSAFQSCAGLSMVTIPPNVTEIGDKAFGSCLNLQNALFLGDAPTMTRHAFSKAPADFRIYFSAQSSGYTIPKWHGYPSSLPQEEIEVRTLDRSLPIEDGSAKNVGNTIVGGKSEAKRFVIRNVGVRKLTGLHAIVKGGDSSDFRVKMLTKNSLAPGQTAFLDILFQPRERGKRYSQLQIMSSDANEDPFEIDLSGLGLLLVK